jgi:hypothetical protein
VSRPAVVRAAAVDFERLFQRLPGLFLILSPDPELVILGATDAYLRATQTGRREILGRRVFAVCPESPGDDRTAGAAAVRSSLNRVLETREVDARREARLQKWTSRRNQPTPATRPLSSSSTCQCVPPAHL